jgi:down-regulator of transcription 1
MQQSLTLCARPEFIHLIASEANEICEKETKKTIAGEHVISALQTLGFEDYVEEVDEVYKEHKKQQKVCIFS